MRLATLCKGSPDGRLVVVSSDGAVCARAGFPALQSALERWDQAAPRIAAIYAFPEALNPDTNMALALNHIRLLVQITDWPRRAMARPEMKADFGRVQAEPRRR